MIISQTPLRISFAGGGTDLPAYYKRRPGRVVNAAIDKYVYVIVTERYDDAIYVGYTKKEIVDSVEDIEHDLVREAMRMTGIDRGIEVTMLADVPAAGSGLGSSSSMTVGLLNAFHAVNGVQVTAETLAAQACQIELDRCRKPIGKQDQYIAAYGGVCVIDFNPDDSVEIEKLALSNQELFRLSQELLLFYTHITRESGPILSEQSSNTSKRLRELDEMRVLADRARDAISNHSYHEIGTILREGWTRKKRLAGGVSTAPIDDMMELAISHGMSGGKIAGAGGGGFLLAHCLLSEQDRLRHALGDFRELYFMFDRDGSKIIFNQRHYAWI